MKRGKTLSLLCLVVPVLAGSSAALAQTSTVVYPQDNVRGGAVGARRPGLWVTEGIGAHGERMNLVLREHGGANPQQSTEPERRTLILTAFLEGLFDVLQNLATALQLAATVGATTTTGT